MYPIGIYRVPYFGYNDEMPRLNDLLLPALPPAVAVPSYDRRAITPGIVHVGVGGFHRAHEAVYLDDLMASGAGREWGICGVGLRPADKAMRGRAGPAGLPVHRGHP